MYSRCLIIFNDPYTMETNLAVRVCYSGYTLITTSYYKPYEIKTDNLLVQMARPQVETKSVKGETGAVVSENDNGLFGSHLSVVTKKETCDL